MSEVLTIPIYTGERSFFSSTVVRAIGTQEQGWSPDHSLASKRWGATRLQELEPIGYGPFFIEQRPLDPPGRTTGVPIRDSDRSNWGCISGASKGGVRRHILSFTEKRPPAFVRATLEIHEMKRGKAATGPELSFDGLGQPGFIRRAPNGPCAVPPVCAGSCRSRAFSPPIPRISRHYGTLQRL